MRFPFLGVYNNAKSKEMFYTSVVLLTSLAQEGTTSLSIEGICSGARFQQPVIRFLTPTETRFFGSCPSGRGGHFVLPLVNNCSIEIANEYISDALLRRHRLFPWAWGRLV